jgi:hypothetical protein
MTQLFNNFLKKAIAIHGDKYDYSKVDYKNKRTNILITCKKHNLDFLQTANTHLQNKGCPVCGRERNAKSRTLTQEDFIEKAVKVWKDRYDFSKVNYKTTKTKIEVICKEHGSFNIEPSNLLSGYGCKKCGNIGWTHTKWKVAGENSNHFDSFKVYLIKCFNENEEFYKIGKTFVKISKRFSGSDILPYEYIVVGIYEGTPDTISKLENELHKKCKDYCYLPKLKFGGQTECFSYQEEVKQIFLQHCQ